MSDIIKVNTRATSIPKSFREFMILWMSPGRYVWAFSMTLAAFGFKRRNVAQEKPEPCSTPTQDSKQI